MGIDFQGLGLENIHAFATNTNDLFAASSVLSGLIADFPSVSGLLSIGPSLYQRRIIHLPPNSKSRSCPAPEISQTRRRRRPHLTHLTRCSSNPNRRRTQGRRRVSPTALRSLRTRWPPTPDITARCPCLRAQGLSFNRTATAARSTPCLRLKWPVALQTLLLLRVSPVALAVFISVVEPLLIVDSFLPRNRYEARPLQILPPGSLSSWPCVSLLALYRRDRRFRAVQILHKGRLCCPLKSLTRWWRWWSYLRGENRENRN